MKNYLTVILAGLAIFLSGCNRAEEANPEGTGIVYVVTDEGDIIQNARVVFESPSHLPDDIEIYKNTDIDGSAFMRWNYHVYVDVVAVKAGYRGCTSLQIIPGETTESTLVMYVDEPNLNGCK